VPNHLTASALLLSHVWEHLRERERADLVVAVPNRDIVLACSMAKTDAVGLLAAMIDQGPDASEPPELTRDLLVWCGEWQLLEEAAD